MISKLFITRELKCLTYTHFVCTFVQKLQTSDNDQLELTLLNVCLQANAELEIQVEQLTSENVELQTALESIEENSITEPIEVNAPEEFTDPDGDYCCSVWNQTNY